ncbi:hypothetical protein [uncultured Maribacter sp.]|uniref:hypothetical protein n=1 Tax=uncultured Maribacter sp. TaxID=431308 RepID=UPI0026077CFB|nr:hypothetical protein [uncultured Maribacter sp.]
MKEAIIKEIVEKVFQKAEKECSKDSKHALSNLIAESISPSAKTIERLYDKYLDKKEGIGEQNEHTINELCKYLNYESYAAYVKQNFSDKKSADVITVGRRKNWKIAAVVSLIVVVGLILGLSEKNKETLCMTWKADHYEKVACSVSFKEKVVPLDEVRLQNFKKVDVNLTTDFFDETTGQPLIWYYKSGNSVEYYTAPGLHPVNGKTLKAITEYMANKTVPVHTFDESSFTQ